MNDFSSASLPPPIAEFVAAVNQGDLDQVLLVFRDDALVNDQLKDYWGLAEIRRWVEQDVLGEKLRFEIVRVVDHHGQIILTVEVDGAFDKRGLPDPLLMSLYFGLTGEHISQLIILPAQGDT